MDKDVWNTQLTICVVQLRGHVHVGIPVFQFRAGSDQVSISRSSLQGMRLELASGNKNTEMCITQTPAPQHQMPCPTDPLLGSSLPMDVHTADGILLELGSAALMQSHLHATSSSSLIVVLCGRHGKGIRSFLWSLLIQHKKSMVNSICSPSFWDRAALGEGTSGT